MIKILFVCHGNICRSTMAESVLTHMVHQLHLDNQFEIDSAATSREEIGNPPHYGTKNKLYEENIPLVPHRARQMTRDDYIYYDYRKCPLCEKGIKLDALVNAYGYTTLG